MTKLLININSIKAAAPFMSTEETRYYLCGMLFQKNLVVATDGHRLAVIKPVNYEGFDGEFIMPSDCIKKIISQKIPKTKTGYVQIDTEAKTAKVFSDHPEEAKGYAQSLGLFKYEPIDGKFPDWRRIIPATDKYETPTGFAVNPKYMGEFQSFGTQISIYPHNERSGAAIIRNKTDHFEAFGLIMPMRDRERDEITIPTWIKEAA